ncbi:MULTISPECIES: alpha/beta fold hydrolase [Streptosporangium]|uniref:Pimeloyl-ACP methyl ester carboxylesterase n=1 Tax=Streptosporangium brasiliense TaxID=47480 RepID=A0ABT9RE86_9ACTN|nr:alpha/beta hydrolase [Streptosporangium brasiliense]MDP9867570.1 pimeloyl-ACP methyl ester carboxylesterase [Streptosporangium brasiliense]
MSQGRMVNVGDVELWTEEFGDPAHPPLLLVMGSMSQGVVWPEELVGRLAAGGRRVIRYDHRDTGRSTTVDFDAHPYTWADVKADVLGVLDAYGIDAAHIVGHSAGGLLGQWIAAEQPERVLTLTVIGSSPLGGREGQVLMRALMGQEQPPGSLPPPAPEFVEFFAKAAVNPPPADRRAQIDFQIELARVLHGTALPFDEDEQRRIEERLHDRAADPAAVANHQRAGARDSEFEPVGILDRVLAPTLVIEGTHEPVKPGHGALIAAAIPGAEFLMIEGMGHTLPPQVHRQLAEAVLAHTAG